MPSTPSNSFFNVFIDDANKLSLEGFQKATRGNRQKKPHSKSRNGCLTCKERRVKCDETYPSCRRCLKRGDTCRRRPVRQQRSLSSIREDHIVSSSCMFSSPISTPIIRDEPFDMGQLRLFYHFQKVTCRTLPVINQHWEDAMPLALEHEFLMHAMLCLAARHLEYLHTEDKGKGDMTLARKHLSSALRLFRVALSHINEENREAVVTTSVLLYFVAWCDSALLPSFHNRDDAMVTYNTSTDQLYTLGKGMKMVCMHAGISTQTHRILRHRPINRIKAVLSEIGRDCYAYHPFFEEIWSDRHDPVVPSRYQEFPPMPVHNPKFCSWQPELSPYEASFGEISGHMAYMDVARRLSVLCSLLPGNQVAGNPTEPAVLETHPSLLPDISRVVFTFPVIFHPAFLDPLYREQSPVLVLLYYFYRTANRLLPKGECWWAARRAESFEAFLKHKLWGST